MIKKLRTRTKVGRAHYGLYLSRGPGMINEITHSHDKEITHSHVQRIMHNARSATSTPEALCGMCGGTPDTHTSQRRAALRAGYTCLNNKLKKYYA